MSHLKAVMHLRKKKYQAGKQSFVSNQLSFSGKLLYKLAEVTSGLQKPGIGS